MKRLALMLAVIASLLVVGVPTITLGATEHCPDGGVKDETGNDGDLVLEAGLLICVKGGTEATGIITTDGTSTLDDYLEDAGITSGESYYVVYGPAPTPTPTPVITPTPTPVVTPTPTPVVTPTPTPVVTPTPTPVITPTPTPPGPTPTPPVGVQFSVETCPVSGEPVPVGQSAIGIRGGLLLILLLNVRVDGELVTLRDVLGDGTFGEVFVTPGVHTVTISNAADTEVLFEEDIFCPECNATVVTPTPPDTTLPPTDTLGSSGGSSMPGGTGLVLLLLGGVIVIGLLGAAIKTNER